MELIIFRSSVLFSYIFTDLTWRKFFFYFYLLTWLCVLGQEYSEICSAHFERTIFWVWSHVNDCLSLMTVLLWERFLMLAHLVTTFHLGRQDLKKNNKLKMKIQLNYTKFNSYLNDIQSLFIQFCFHKYAFSCQGVWKRIRAICENNGEFHFFPLRVQISFKNVSLLIFHKSNW